MAFAQQDSTNVVVTTTEPLSVVSAEMETTEVAVLSTLPEETADSVFTASEKSVEAIGVEKQIEQVEKKDVTLAEDSVAQSIFPEPETEFELKEEVHQPAPWESGLMPLERPGHGGHDQIFVTLVVLLMLSICLSFRNIRRVCGILYKRVRSNRMPEEFENTTSDEKRTIGLLLTVAVFFIAFISTAGLSLTHPLIFRFTLLTTLRIGVLVAGYFLFQYFIYWLVGYTFTGEDGRRFWIEGFTAAMSLLGLVLILPGLAVMFYPDVAAKAIMLSIGCYIVARITFICKGFRIFYTNLGSLVYFILYLCTLEIIPLIILYFLACLLS